MDIVDLAARLRTRYCLPARSCILTGNNRVGQDVRARAPDEKSLSQDEAARLLAGTVNSNLFFFYNKLKLNGK